MVDFRRMISPCVQKRMREDEAEMARLHALGDQALAREILDLARRTVELRNDAIEIAYLTYTTALTLQTIPVLAKRLDPQLVLNDLEMKAIEAGRRDRVCDIESFEGDALRAHVGSMISNAMMTYGLDGERAEAREIRMLSRLLEHGNPVALMVDRLAPAPRDIDRVVRPGSGGVIYPAWSPEDPRAPLEGLWLMVTHGGGQERVKDYFDHHADAEDMVGAVARDGLAQGHRLLRRILGTEPKVGDPVTIRLRNNDDEVVGDALEVIVRAKDEEPLPDEDCLTM